MAIYDNDIVANYEIGKIYDNDITASHQIGKVYDNDGTANHLIYTAQSDVMTLSCTTTQGENSMWWNNAYYTVPADYTKLVILESNWGKSYGDFQTEIWIGGNRVVSRGGGYNGYHESVAAEPIVGYGTTYTVTGGTQIRLAVGASFNPNVSGQFQTTSYFNFYLTN